MVYIHTNTEFTEESLRKSGWTTKQLIDEGYGHMGLRKADWTEAPDDAEFYGHDAFYKRGEDGTLLYYSIAKWLKSGFNLAQLKKFENYEERPEPIMYVAPNEKTLEAWSKEHLRPQEPNKDGSKYHCTIVGLCGKAVTVDVYRVLDAFETGSAEIDHAVKKLLKPGLRGHKDELTDLYNAIESIEARINLIKQKQELNKC